MTGMKTLMKDWIDGGSSAVHRGRSPPPRTLGPGPGPTLPPVAVQGGEEASTGSREGDLGHVRRRRSRLEGAEGGESESG